MWHRVMKEKINIQFLIEEISTLEFSIKNQPSINIDDYENLVINVNPSSSVDIKSGIVDFIIMISIHSGGKEKIIICELVTSIKFAIKNFAQFLDKENNKLLRMPDQFMHTMLSIALSTSRGILASKTEGTNLQKVYLPILNPADFKPEVDSQITS